LKEEINIFIGWDSREDIAYQVCKHSIERRTKKANVHALKQNKLRQEELYWREPDELASTEFTFTRFLIPEIMEYNGWALFMDCDMLVTTDIKELFDQRDDQYAVMCVKHDYKPKSLIKMDGKPQLMYPRKNWSSVMLFNCAHPSNAKLTRDRVNNENLNGAYFHRFQWLKDEEIGELHHTWNYLVGWYDDIETPSLIHYTEGGPWFDSYKDCEFASEWNKEKDDYEYRKNYYRKKHRLDPLDGLPSNLEKLGEELLDIIVDPQGLYHQSDINLFSRKLKEMSTLTPTCYCFAESPNPEEKGYDRVAHKFAIGAGGKLINFNQLETIDIDVPVIIRGNSKSKVRAINKCIERGLDWYNIDTGYLGNGNLKHYHRISKGAYQNIEPIIDRPSDRLEKIKFKLYKRKEKGERILLCPPSQKVMSIYGLTVDEWVESTVKKIKQHSGREIVVRIKEQNRKQRVASDPIQSAFNDDIFCVITFNSIAALEAVMYGLPAFTLGPNAAESLCNTDLHDIEHPYFPEEEEILKVLRHLSYCQFTEAEYKDGTAWKILNESS